MRILPMLWLSGVIAFCPLLMPVSSSQQRPVPTPIVIIHATVVNPGTSSVQANRSVVIAGDHITSVSDTAKFQSPKDARVIDGTGQYLIPGFWDMHVHSAFGDWFPGGRDIILPLFIANGVTGVRDMGGDAPVLLEWRKEIVDGHIIGPRMIISGPMLDGYLANGKLRFPSSIAITTPASAVAAVHSLRRRVWTSSKSSPPSRTMPILRLQPKPTNKACPLSAMYRTKFALRKLSMRGKRVSNT
jgi:hypothetical protein